MKTLIENFSNQLNEGLEIGKSTDITPATTKINNVVISGLGGSGIGGTLVSQLTSKQSICPIIANNGYSIPGFVGENTLLIICSYSGNTEETISAMNIGIEKKAEIACITSGGKVLEKAHELGFNNVVIPGGMPPRSCLGYSLTQLFFLLNKYGIIDNTYISEIRNSIGLIKHKQDDIINEAKEIANLLNHKTPVIYASSEYEGMVVRLRQQINENSKLLCWHHVFPEMNHNELVGWTDKNENLAIVLFRDNDDHPQVKKRMDICKPIFQKYTPNIIEVFSKGTSMIEKTIYFIHLGDWISYFLGINRGVDITEVNVIDYLKSELAK
jgi:glucose/mannose-6-phosphate isomerase